MKSHLESSSNSTGAGTLARTVSTLAVTYALSKGLIMCVEDSRNFVAAGVDPTLSHTHSSNAGKPVGGSNL